MEETSNNPGMTCGRSHSEHASRPQPRARDWVETRDFGPMLERVRPFTMVPTDSLVQLARQVRTILMYNIPGHFVECGVWRGGASFLMADLLRQADARSRKVWLCDSFEGMPPPDEIDGSKAQEWARNTARPGCHDNLRVSREEVQRCAADLGLAPYTEFVKGWFEQTLPTMREAIGPIAILRIDCDWYTSVRCCLENLYDSVVAGGLVIFDDYYTYDGCAIAVHEFLGQRHLSHRIESFTGRWQGYVDCQGALFCKANTTWASMSQVYFATQELAPLIEPGETLILVDEGQWGSGNFFPGCTGVPFLERDGVYWGHPPDDETAIAELDRLRHAGASFMVFAWPAFWWLDYYADFHRHLRSTSRCVLENDRLVVFDLRPPA